MRESTLWFFHFIAGAVILFLLGIHMGVMHWDYILVQLGMMGDKEVLSYASVVQRSEMVFHLVVYIMLLGLALYHGLYGFRSIVLELSFVKTIHRPVSIVITIGGFLLFIFGAYAIIIGFTG